MRIPIKEIEIERDDKTHYFVIIQIAQWLPPHNYPTDGIPTLDGLLKSNHHSST